MRIRRFSLRVLVRSLAGRRVGSLLVSGSIAIATSVVVALLCLSIDVQRKLTTQLAEFGANVALVPDGSESTLSTAAATALLSRLPAGSVAAPVLYTTANLAEGDHASLLVAGVEPATIQDVVRLRISGRALPTDDGPASPRIPGLAGGRLARRLHLLPGSVLPIELHGRRVEIAIVGLMSSGEGEEEELFLPLGRLEGLAGLEGRSSAVLVRVPGRPEEVSRALRTLSAAADVHGIEAKLLRRVAASAAVALGKIQGLLSVLSLLVATASLLSAGMVLMEQAVERRAEVGLMKSLGAADRGVAALVLAQAAALGLLGGVLGTGVGIGIADLLERVVFAASLSVPLAVIPLGVLLALVLALAAAALPLRLALAVEPAAALREARA